MEGGGGGSLGNIIIYYLIKYIMYTCMYIQRDNKSHSVEERVGGGDQNRSIATPDRKIFSRVYTTTLICFLHLVSYHILLHILTFFVVIIRLFLNILYFYLLVLHCNSSILTIKYYHYNKAFCSCRSTFEHMYVAVYATSATH